MADWLDAEPSVGADWLDGDDTPVAGIEIPKSAVPYMDLRFQCMRGSGRVWACDGRYVAYRPHNHVLDKQVNPAFQERIARFRDAGHFKHLGTYDEVEIYQLLPGSPWYAKTEETYTAGVSLMKDIVHAAKLACKRDWNDYVDLLQAMAQGMMAGRDPMFAKKCWEDALNLIMVEIYQRQGPLPGEIRAGCANVQKARGGYRQQILLATDVAHTKNVQFEGK